MGQVNDDRYAFLVSQLPTYPHKQRNDLELEYARVNQATNVIKFGSNNPAIAYQNSLTNQASVLADGWTIFTNTLIDSRGVSLTASTDGGLSHSSLLTAEQKNTLLTSGGQISFTIPTFYVAADNDNTAANNSTGYIRGGIERLVGWDNVGIGSNFGGFTGRGNKTTGFVMESSDTDGNMFLSSDDKPIDSTLTLSFIAGGTVQVFINGKFIRTMINQGGDFLSMPAGLFDNFRIGNRFGNSEWMTGGFVKDFIISTKPASFIPIFPNGVTFFGHSFVAGSTGESNVLFDNMDALINYSFEHQLYNRGYEVGGPINFVSLGGGYVSDIALTKLSTITGAAAATNPDLIVAFMGGNDALNIGLIPDANFLTELDLRIDELMASPTNPDLIFANINTLKFDATYDTPGNVIEVANKNAIIASSPQRWSARKLSTQGTIYVVDVYNYLGGENPPLNTYIGQTVTFANENVHPMGNGNKLLGQVLGQVALQLI